MNNLSQSWINTHIAFIKNNNLLEAEWNVVRVSEEYIDIQTEKITKEKRCFLSRILEHCTQITNCNHTTIDINGCTVRILCKTETLCELISEYKIRISSHHLQELLEKYQKFISVTQKSVELLEQLQKQHRN